MKKTSKITLILLMSSSSIIASNNFKIYDIKSAKVEYSIKGSGNILGSSSTTEGTKKVVFDNYGVDMLTHETKVDTQTVMGKTNSVKTDYIELKKEASKYIVNFEHQRITRSENLSAAITLGNNMQKNSEEMMKKMGGKKIGTDKVLDYTCDVWNLMGTKQCIYKGLPLRVESKIMGITNIEVATKAEFNVAISKDDLKLPDFPVYEIDPSNMQNGYVELDKNKLAEMDKKSIQNADKSRKELAQLKVTMENAAKSAGVKDGERPTKAQQKAMQESMMSAILPQIKKKTVDEEKILLVGYKCIKDAHTLKEANICNDKLNAMGGEEEEPFTEWNPKIKKEVLGYLNNFLNVIAPCIKKAQNMQDLKACNPNN